MKNIFAGAMALVVLVSCSAGGGTGSAPRLATTAQPIATPSATSSPSAKTQAVSGTLALYFQQRTSDTHRRARAFLSPSAASVSIAVTGEPAVVADISANSPNCTTPTPAPISSGGASPAPATRTCNVTVLAPVGTNTFSATLYDGPNATGNVLGTGTATQTVLNATPFMVEIGVMGALDSITVTVNPSTFTLGTPGTATVRVSAYDADGNLISGTYGSPVTLTDSDTTGVFSLSNTAFAGSTATATLTYSGAVGRISTATISATSAGVPSSDVTPQTVSAVAPPDLYAAQTGSSAITITPDNATLPTRTIAGSQTGLSALSGIAVDSSGTTYVTTTVVMSDGGGQAAIEEFSPGAGGNVTARQAIVFDDNYFIAPTSLAVDSNDNVYGAFPSLGEVNIFPPGSVNNSGGTSVTNSAMDGPIGVAVDAQNVLYVTDNAAAADNETDVQDSVFVFPANANGNTVPSRRIIGADTGLSNPMNLTVDSSGSIYVVNDGTETPGNLPSVTVYAPGANGDAVPVRTIGGSATTLSNPVGIAVGTNGFVYVSDSATSAIDVFAPDANGNVAPSRVISGSGSGMSSPAQITLGPLANSAAPTSRR